MIMPLRETAFQGYVFLCLCYAGFISGVLCDVLLPIKRISKALPAAAQSMFAAVLYFAACSLISVTKVRPFTVLSFWLGSAIYRFGVRHAAISFVNLFLKKRKTSPGIE